MPNFASSCTSTCHRRYAWRISCTNPASPERTPAQVTHRRSVDIVSHTASNSTPWLRFGGNHLERVSSRPFDGPESGGPTQPWGLDLRAGIHHHGEPGSRNPGGRVLVHDTELEPHRLRPGRDRLVGVRTGELAAPEHVHDVDRKWNLGQCAVGLLAEDGLAP